MALGTWIAGRFSATYDPPGATAAADVGYTEDGYQISWNYSVDAIQATDAHGDAYLDGVFRGLRDVLCRSQMLEWKNGLLQALTPFQALAASGNTYLGPGVIGRLQSDMAGILIFSATASTPAALAPASLTATYAILQEGQNVDMLLNSKLRKCPLPFRFLPYADAGDANKTKYFTAT